MRNIHIGRVKKRKCKIFKSLLRNGFRFFHLPIDVGKNPPKYQEHTRKIGCAWKENRQNIKIWVNKFYNVSNIGLEEYVFCTCQKMKIENFFRSSKKRFMDQNLFNSCREEPPVVSGTCELNWNGYHRKKSTSHNFSQQNGWLEKYSFRTRQKMIA